MTNIEKLRDLAEKLLGLLKDPQPGYFTWHECVHRVAQEIGEFVGMVPQSAFAAGNHAACEAAAARTSSENRFTIAEIEAMIQMAPRLPNGDVDHAKVIQRATLSPVTPDRED